MKHEELLHVLRASAAVTQEHSFVIVGSQAVLLSHPNAPDELLRSRELDLYPAMAPEKAELIEGALGALSQFDDTFGYYADGVGPETAVMPADWITYAQLHYIGELTAIVPDLHDIAVSKCVAGREKDAAWVAALLRHKMIELPRFIERLRALDPARHDLDRLVAWANRRAAEAGA
jgi:hypothetical protein